VQSKPKKAQSILDSIKKKEKNFEKRRDLVREEAKDILLDDFISAVSKLSATDSAIPNVCSAVGHRWSAAFPIPTQEAETDDDNYFERQQNFVACGDYMGKYTGRIEGAYLSGKAAAATILKYASINQNEAK